MQLNRPCLNPVMNWRGGAVHDLACFVSQSSVRLMLFCDLHEMLYTHTSRSRIACRAHTVLERGAPLTRRGHVLR